MVVALVFAAFVHNLNSTNLTRSHTKKSYHSRNAQLKFYVDWTKTFNIQIDFSISDSIRDSVILRWSSEEAVWAVKVSSE